jgi:hypothetical protein
VTAVLDIPAVELRPRPSVDSSLPSPRRDFRRGVAAGALLLAVSWPLGVVYIGWVVVGGLALLACIRRRYTTFPKAVAGWFAVLALFLLSAAQVETQGRAVAFAYRYSLYLSATIICLYLYNARERFTLHRVMGVLGGIYVVVVISGIAGLLYPDFLQPSLLLRAMPTLPPEARFVVDTMSMRLSEVQNILQNGTASPRPKGVFAYTNDWASVYAVTTVALLSYLQQQRRLRPVWLGLAAAGLWPFLESLSRAAWVTLLLGLGVIVIARTVRAGVRQVLPIVLIAGAGAAIVMSGPAINTIHQRLETAHSDNGREIRVNEAITRVADQPLTGYGTPLPSYNQGGPSVGTHGEFWLLLFCQGYPGAIAFVAFLLALTAFAVRAGPAAEPLLGALAVLIAQAFFYEWMALQLALLLALIGTTAGHVALTRYRTALPPTYPANMRTTT